MMQNIKEVLNKLNKLEREIKTIENTAKDIGVNKICSRQKDLLNYSCVDIKRIEFDNIKFMAGDNLLIECEFEFVAANIQEIEISIVVSGIILTKSKFKSIVGINKVSLAKEFFVLESKNQNISVYVKPLAKKQILINKCLINIWGGQSDEDYKKYNVIELDEKYLLSFIKDDIVYYNLITKESSMLAELDFEFCAYAKDYNFAYIKNLDKLILFRIDEDDNLIMDNLSTGEVLLLDNKVTGVSASFSDDKVVATYIKNDTCYVVEFEGSSIFSKTKLYCENVIKKSLIFYNHYSQKFFFILNLLSGKNIMIEEQKETGSFGEHLYLNYDIFATGYEVKNYV